MRSLSFAIACGVFALGCASVERTAPAPITAEAILRHVTVLADDAFEGRAPATEGEERTVAYLVEAMRAAGLEPANGASFVQPVPLAEIAVQGAPALTMRAAGGAARTLAFGTDWVGSTRRFAAETTVEEAPLVFVGYGATAPERGFEDYAGVDMRGKIAVILINDADFETAGDSLEGPFGGKAMTLFGRWTYKFDEAARQGAIGALIVHETAPASYGWEVVQSSWSGPQVTVRRPDGAASLPAFEAWITRDVAEALFQAAGQDFAALKRAAQQPGFKPVPLPLSASTHFDVQTREIVTANVAGIVRGAERPDEVVIYSAHWDHLGRCPPIDGDDICNGAIDNASGLGALIEIGRAFASGPRPKRSVMLLAVGAEESGLLGSAHYAANPLFPLHKTLANLNMDGPGALGPARDIAVVGAGKSTLEDILAEEAKTQRRVVTPEANPERGYYYRSDQFSFASVGVPALYTEQGLDLVDGGRARGEALDAEYIARLYHKPADQLPGLLDPAGVALDATLLFQVGRRVANGEAWPVWRADAEFRPIRERSLAASR